ncbi:hypothetical protein KSS87_017356, partial [Heliosperma pusillum]
KLEPSQRWINPESGRSREYWGQCVLGFLVDYRIFKVEAINDHIRKKWSMRGEIEVLKLGDLYAFHCASEDDRDDLLKRTFVSLWGAFMVFSQWFPDTIPKTVRFPYADLWVRICGLPFEYLTMETANIAGHLLSNHYEVESFYHFPKNDYLRIKVRVQLNEPLVPGFFLALDGGYLLWVQCRYEEVFKYCIRCGKIGHTAACCKESIMTIVSSVNGMLEKATGKGFTVFQAQSNHTMFNLDLRACPSTSKYVCSSVRLGRAASSRARTNTSDSEEEYIIDFDLGTTPGGRVFPVMRFTVTSQPFAGPVIFNVNATEPGSGLPNNVGSMFGEGAGVAMHAENPSNDYPPTTNHEAMNVEMTPITSIHVPSVPSFPPSGVSPLTSHVQADPIITTRTQDVSNINPVLAETRGDPYANFVSHYGQAFKYDRDIHIQDAILNRVEKDFDWARMDDDNRGYNQTFDLPVQNTNGSFHFDFNMDDPSNDGPTREEAHADLDLENANGAQNNFIIIDDSSSSNYSTPEWPLISSDSEFASADMLTADLLQDDIPDESRGEGVNQMIDLNLGAEPDSPFSADGIVRSQCAEVDVLQATSIGISDCLPAPVHDARKAHSTGDLPAKFGFSEIVTSSSYVTKKRKCSSEIGEAVIPEDSLLSVAHAKSYLFYLSKKRCCYGNGIAVSAPVSAAMSSVTVFAADCVASAAKNSKEYGFHMKIDDDDAGDLADGPDQEEHKSILWLNANGVINVLFSVSEYYYRPMADQDMLKEVAINSDPSEADLEYLDEMTGENEKDSSQLSYLVQHWEYKQANAVRLLKEEVDHLSKQREEAELKRREIFLEQYRFDDDRIASERHSTAESKGLEIDAEYGTVVYWKQRAVFLEKMLEESRQRERSLLEKLEESIKNMEKQSSPVQELSDMLKRADNFIHFILQNAPIVLGHMDIIGKTDAEIFFGAGVKESLDLKREVLERGIPAKREITFETELFGSKTFLIHVEPVLNKAGETIGINYVGMDITDQIIKRERMAQLREEIAVQRAMETELNKTIHITEETMRAKQMLATMSHEIRSPLTAVVGMADILSTTTLDRQQRELLNVIISSADLVLQLTNDILDLSKVESGVVRLEATKFRPREVVRHVLQTAATSLRKILTLEGHISDDVPIEVIGDVPRIRQILTNLISNGIKFTHEGKVGIRLYVVSAPYIGEGDQKFVNDHADNKETQGENPYGDQNKIDEPKTPSKGGEFVDDRSYAAQSPQTVWIRCDVYDTGIGIAEHALPTLFKKYMQASADHARKYGGTGLGLAICKQLIDGMFSVKAFVFFITQELSPIKRMSIDVWTFVQVELMGGHLTVSSKEHCGSTFTFELPYRVSPSSGNDSDDPDELPDATGQGNDTEADDLTAGYFLFQPGTISPSLFNSSRTQSTYGYSGLPDVNPVSENAPAFTHTTTKEMASLVNACSHVDLDEALSEGSSKHSGNADAQFSGTSVLCGDEGNSEHDTSAVDGSAQIGRTKDSPKFF